MNLTIYQADAFTDKLFGGNPAAVCPLQEWLPDELMQQIALENNLSETAFIVPDGTDYAIRWFTPTVEVDLCGHATLATAHICFTELKHPEKKIVFQSKSGPLTVRQSIHGYTMDFPIDPIQAVDIPLKMVEALGGVTPIATFKGSTDYMVLLDSQQTLEQLVPNYGVMASIPARGIIVTAKGEKVDIVSRFFCPQSGIDEDPVTGSAHTTLIPFWSKKLDKTILIAQQFSQRGGILFCELKQKRVLISGNAVTYMKGSILVEDSTK